MATTSFKIIIVGGGIAGLAAAIALRAEGRIITVLEQSLINKEIGATISLQPNASKIVEGKWSLEAVLKERGSMVDEAFEVYNTDGKLEMRIPLSTKKRFGAERMMYHRADLHEILKAKAMAALSSPPVEVKVSSRVIGCNCETGEVRLENGDVLQGHLVIGADGIKSTLRKDVLEKEIDALPTGLSAYRMMIPTEELLKEIEFVSVINPQRSCTTMVMGQDRRLVMGPARDGSIYGVVALVPDDSMHESSRDTTWTTQGDRSKMLSSFAHFPAWAQRPLHLAKDVGLWQLRDLDPLPTWYRGRVLLIGDAAHAMLPTQGQGASQAIEDAEAVGAFYEGFETKNRPVSLDDVQRVNEAIFRCRYDRATTVQAYSRAAAKPATDPGDSRVEMSPAEFMEYNCSYDGALEWNRRSAAAAGM